MGEHAEEGTQWVDGRLRRVRGDGTLGTTCLHGVGLTAGLWCGACMDIDPRVLPEPPVTADHAGGLSATGGRVVSGEVEALTEVLRAHRWTLRAGACHCGWKPETLLLILASHRSHVAEHLTAYVAAARAEEREAALAEVRALADEWRRQAAQSLIGNPNRAPRISLILAADALLTLLPAIESREGDTT